MSIASGFTKMKNYILTSSGYKLLSRWTSSQTVHMGDGTDDTDTVEYRFGTMKGITSSLATDNDEYALSASAGKNLQDQCTQLNQSLNNCLKSVSDGKSTVASAITAQGVSTAADAEFATMATNIASAGNARYNSGYSKGVTDADNRVNSNSKNYKTGYNAGVAAGKNAVPSFDGYTNSDVTFDFNNITSVYIRSGSFIMYGSNSLTSGFTGQGSYSGPITITKSTSGYRYIKLSGAISFNVSPKK